MHPLYLIDDIDVLLYRGLANSHHTRYEIRYEDTRYEDISYSYSRERIITLTGFIYFTQIFNISVNQ